VKNVKKRVGVVLLILAVLGVYMLAMPANTVSAALPSSV